ncbi:MAG TPA: hypothetical protein ENN09_00025 [Planctomycetes bacterium]|nr:hypothetical protein [Planctomycetota bacterium]
MRLAFWDGVLALYWNGSPAWHREMNPRRRLAEIRREPSSVSVAVEKGEAKFRRITIQRDIYYTAGMDGDRQAMTQGAYGPLYTLGGDEYFFLGDNSPSSRDSRYWGAIKRDALVGRAWFIFWPPHRARWIK